MEEGTTTKAVVLVIEDQPVLRMMAVDLVEDAGYVALEARNGDEAVQLLETHLDIRLVFSDIDLKDGEDGLKFMHAVRDRWPPVGLIIISGKRKLEPHHLPARGEFFSKPYRRPEVTAAMRRLVA